MNHLPRRPCLHMWQGMVCLKCGISKREYELSMLKPTQLPPPPPPKDMTREQLEDYKNGLHRIMVLPNGLKVTGRSLLNGAGLSERAITHTEEEECNHCKWLDPYLCPKHGHPSDEFRSWVLQQGKRDRYPRWWLRFITNFSLMTRATL